MDKTLPLPVETRATLSAALTPLGDEIVAIASALWEVEPSAGSRVQELIQGKSLPESDFADVTISVAAATDEFNAFVWVLGGDGAYGPSMASLTRSCVETLGRAWWLMASSSAAVLAHRSAAFQVSESAYIANNKGEVARRDAFGQIRRLKGDEITAYAAERFEARRVEGEKAKAPGYRELATDLLAAVNSPNSGLDYSHLSGAAHGERTALGSFGNPRPGPPGTARVGLDLPVTHANLYIWILVHSIDRVLVSLFEMWGEASDDLHRRWARAIRPCEAILEQTLKPFYEE